MLYILICDEMSKSERCIVKKVKVEIKGENVRLISTRVGPTTHRDPMIAP